MITVHNKKELDAAIRNGETRIKVADKKLLKALATVCWIKENPIKGALLAASLPTIVAGGFVAAPVFGIVGAGLAIGGISISAAEIIALGAVIIGILAVLKDYKHIRISKDGTIEIDK